MNTTNMPGFTAETSVYTSSVCYRSMPAGPQGEGPAIIPAQFDCFGSHKCTPCIPLGPSIFSPGRQFCIDTSCQPTFGGGCRCHVLFKGFVPCRPSGPGGVLTARE